MEKHIPRRSEMISLTDDSSRFPVDVKTEIETALDNDDAFSQIEPYLLDKMITGRMEYNYYEIQKIINTYNSEHGNGKIQASINSELLNADALIKQAKTCLRRRYYLDEDGTYLGVNRCNYRLLTNNVVENANHGENVNHGEDKHETV